MALARGSALGRRPAGALTAEATTSRVLPLARTQPVLPQRCTSLVVAHPAARRSSTLASAAAAPPAPLKPGKKGEKAASVNGPSTSLTFNIHYATTFGEVVKMVGAGAALGSWDVQHAVTLKWTEGDIWTAKLALSADSSKHEYKFVVYDTRSKTIKWEKGPNRVLDMANTPLVLDMEWSSLYVPSAQGDSSETPLSKEELEARNRERREASDAICMAFTHQVARAKPGSVWAAVKPALPVKLVKGLEAGAAVLGSTEAEFASVVRARKEAEAKRGGKATPAGV